MKFGQLIKCNMRKNFFEKSYRKCCGETIPRHFYKKPKLSISLNNFAQFVFIVWQVDSYQNILKVCCRPLSIKSYKAFSKNKKNCETSPPASFSA